MMERQQRKERQTSASQINLDQSKCSVINSISQVNVYFYSTFKTTRLYITCTIITVTKSTVNIR